MSFYYLSFYNPKQDNRPQHQEPLVGTKWLTEDVAVGIYKHEQPEILGHEFNIDYFTDEARVWHVLRGSEDEFCKVMCELMDCAGTSQPVKEKMIGWLTDRFEYTGGEYVPETVELYEKLNRWGLVSTPVGMLNPDFQYHHRVVLGDWDLRLEAIHKSSLPLNNMKELVYHDTPIYSLYEIPEGTHPVLVAWYRVLSCETQVRQSKVQRQLYLELLKALFEYQSSL